MKKNKTIAYMLAVTLLVGGTFLGTKALFTDNVEVAGELAISTGDVDIEVVENETGWKLDRNGIELAEGTYNVKDEKGQEGYAGIEHPGKEEVKESSEIKSFANNLKDGDVLTKTVVVQNMGTLNATKLKIEKNSENTTIPTWISVETGKITTLEGVEIVEANVIKPKDKVKVELKLTVNATGEHNINGQNSDTQENAVINLTDAWTLTAEQTQQAQQ